MRRSSKAGGAARNGRAGKDKPRQRKTPGLMRALEGAHGSPTDRAATAATTAEVTASGVLSGYGDRAADTASVGSIGSPLSPVSLPAADTANTSAERDSLPEVEPGSSLPSSQSYLEQLLHASLEGRASDTSYDAPAHAETQTSPELHSIAAAPEAPSAHSPPVAVLTADGRPSRRVYFDESALTEQSTQFHRHEARLALRRSAAAATPSPPPERTPLSALLHHVQTQLGDSGPISTRTYVLPYADDTVTTLVRTPPGQKRAPASVRVALSITAELHSRVLSRTLNSTPAMHARMYADAHALVQSTAAAKQRRPAAFGAHPLLLFVPLRLLQGLAHMLHKQVLAARDPRLGTHVIPFHATFGPHGAMRRNLFTVSVPLPLVHRWELDTRMLSVLEFALLLMQQTLVLVATVVLCVLP